MSSTEYQHSDGDEYVAELVHTDAQTAEITGHLPYRVLHASSVDGEVVGGGSDIETVTVEVVDGLEVARGTSPSEAAVLDVDGEATVVVDGGEQVVALTGGSGSLEVSTTAAAGSTISVEAVGLAEHPADSDRAEINVVSN